MMKTNLRELNTEMQIFLLRRDTLKAKWKQEKELVEKVQNAKAEIEQLKTSRQNRQNEKVIMEKLQKYVMEK